MTDNIQDIWNVWYHSSKNSSWSNQSYKNIFEICNLYDLKYFVDVINLNHIKTGMFFIMRKNIFPTWEDKENRRGCCISYKVYDNIVKNKLVFIILEILLDKLNIDNNRINGISIAPKKNYCIIKLWLKKNIRKEYIKNIKINDTSFSNKYALVKKNIN